MPCAHCARKFASAEAVAQHIRHRHPNVKGARKAKPPATTFQRSTADLADVYAMVEELDLPDGAHWAMLEELTGCEPADFAFLDGEA